jgi:hypothetical protein
VCVVGVIGVIGVIVIRHHCEGAFSAFSVSRVVSDGKVFAVGQTSQTA